MTAATRAVVGSVAGGVKHMSFGGICRRSIARRHNAHGDQVSAAATARTDAVRDR